MEHGWRGWARILTEKNILIRENPRQSVLFVFDSRGQGGQVVADDACVRVVRPQPGRQDGQGALVVRPRPGQVALRLQQVAQVVKG